MAYLLRYDGTNDRVSVPSVDIGFTSTKFTWTGSFDLLAGADRGLFQDWAGGAGTSRLVCWYDEPNGLTFIIQEGGGGNSTQTTGITGLSTGVRYRVEVSIVNGSSVSVDVYNDETSTLVGSKSQSHSITYLNIDSFFIGDSTDLTRPFDGDIYRFTVHEEGILTHDYDPSASNGTGSILPDTAGTNDGNLINFPTDDSQWVPYDTTPQTGTFYELEWRLLNNVGGETLVTSITAEEYLLEGLTESSDYEYRVRETIEGTSSAWSAWYQFSTIAAAIGTTGVSSAVNVGTPSIAQNHNFTSIGINSTTSVTSPSIGQIHNLTSIAIDSVVNVALPLVGQNHNLTSSAAQSQSNVGAPTASSIENVDSVTTVGVQSTTSVGVASIGQNHSLATDGLNLATNTNTPVVGQNHNLASIAVKSESNVGAAAVGQNHNLTSSAMQSATNTGRPTATSTENTDSVITVGIDAATNIAASTVGQNQNLASDGIDSVANISALAVSQNHLLSTNGLESTTNTGRPAATSEIVYDSVSTAGIDSTLNVASPNIGQNHNLATTSVYLLSEFSLPSVGQNHFIVTGSIELLSNVGQPTAGEAESIIDYLLTVEHIQERYTFDSLMNRYTFEVR